MLVTNRDERIVTGATLRLDGVERTIESARRHHDRWLVRFDGVTDRPGAEALTGRAITGAPLGEPPPDELWVHELIGAVVRDAEGREHGPVVAVQANPAHDLLVLESGALIPMPFVVALRDGIVDVAVPDGLLDGSL